MSTFVKEYTNRCERCARIKPSNLAPPGKLRPLELPDIPWTEVTADFTTDLPLLQTHINFPRFLPIFPDFLERLSHLAPIY
jgi:hypothetical protein